MCVESAHPPLVTASDDDYYMVARSGPRNGGYFLDVWRTCRFEDVNGAVFALANTPGVLHTKSEYSEWEEIPVDDLGQRSICSPMWGVRSRFVYPEDYDELEALFKLARQ